ncbi:tetratricopeptide repeat protein [Aurantiacibacter flavus]|uniref:Tetratricopeptide repeat protein n=1 Tax=Aurantiacibacter flavus TaxID=3145232 RepID=A0ABV0CTC6_9SPHN
MTAKTVRRSDNRSALMEKIMRLAPAAAALSLLFAVTASMSAAGERADDPRASALVAEGRQLLNGGDTQAAIDAFEAALAVDPGMTSVFLDLAEAARTDGLQGKAIRYYREARERDPNNFAAISGEGEALVEKGAMTAAREALTELEERCGETCVETRQLAAAIAARPAVMTAEATPADNGVTQN